ncbi:SLATT domain-containing protein [Streptomyces hygroscopicus]|uniref:SLATT domain-containing protein n=1 Tax=Streptomyces hygroscopicus TaxID=1912 RepID=UPI000AB1F699|nr:SLATT domain-containing protein [Streptomyces sp. NBRC 109436]
MARLTEAEITALESEYREKSRAYDHALENLKATRFQRRMYYLIAFGSMILTGLLGYTVVIGLWEEKPTFTRWAGLIIVAVLWVAAGVMLMSNRKTKVDHTSELRQKLAEKQNAAAALPLDSEAALRIYRESTLELMDAYRVRATRNRRSIVASTLVAMDNNITPLNLAATILSATVGVSAGLSGYFKFRERGFNLQSTADELEKHYTAVQFHLDEYESVDPSLTPEEGEKERLRRFARLVEKIKEEQRKRELQLEQSPEQQRSQ